ncbi:glucoside xylosyltransferase 1 isoform X2 [Stomoxys calcitrans]|uniref:UDP-D-xylose:beta-D-glucoside alpha-1,3-D-xylosyltransferase n=1 Tax=Stomoxys calcitrans TaxID=35570 RepID=A0A1I8PBE2_STOCA|nr:glucoside xylosyltransferase 1 isoform X2 [Stomoxys calcitrans]
MFKIPKFLNLSDQIWWKKPKTATLPTSIFPSHTTRKRVVQERRFNIAVVACGQRLQETLTMIKSALLFNHYKDKLHFLVFSEDQLGISFKEKLSDWKSLIPDIFDFDVLPLRFPPNSETEWKTLFKPCAAQRLFLPSLLQSFESLLYVDTDIIFLSPVSEVWNFLAKFNESQFAALTPEHEDPNIGWYNRFARHPYYGSLGVNSGVMLMNLTRMRQFKWEEHVLPIHREYKLRITWGDQDIINILFYYHPEKLYILPCEFNYRPDHCMYMNVCNTSTNGIKIIHGNRGYFHSNKQPLFRAVFEAIENYQIGNNPYIDFLIPLLNALEDPLVLKSNCGKLRKEATLTASKIFIEQ